MRQASALQTTLQSLLPKTMEILKKWTWLQKINGPEKSSCGKIQKTYDHGQDIQSYNQ
jgi:hypothetical protein